eukprot:3241265-Rhodomonas_salina.1
MEPRAEGAVLEEEEGETLDTEALLAGAARWEEEEEEEGEEGGRGMSGAGRERGQARQVRWRAPDARSHELTPLRGATGSCDQEGREREEEEEEEKLQCVVCLDAEPDGLLPSLLCPLPPLSPCVVFPSVPYVVFPPPSFPVHPSFLGLQEWSGMRCTQ